MRHQGQVLAIHSYPHAPGPRVECHGAHLADDGPQLHGREEHERAARVAVHVQLGPQRVHPREARRLITSQPTPHPVTPLPRHQDHARGCVIHHSPCPPAGRSTRGAVRGRRWRSRPPVAAGHSPGSATWTRTAPWCSPRLAAPRTRSTTSCAGRGGRRDTENTHGEQQPKMHTESTKENEAGAGPVSHGRAIPPQADGAHSQD
jgi:hypothetical protein